MTTLAVFVPLFLALLSAAWIWCARRVAAAIERTARETIALAVAQGWRPPQAEPALCPAEGQASMRRSPLAESIAPPAPARLRTSGDTLVSYVAAHDTDRGPPLYGPEGWTDLSSRP